MKNSDAWFEVDKEGLSRLLERRGKAFVLFELIQNAWDENVSRLDVRLRPARRAGLAEIEVTDNSPEGFKALTHAYTLFADSSKKSDTQKRGRFNFGEKMVLALCREAEISSTTGTIYFTRNGRRQVDGSKRTTAGTVFRALLRLTRAEVAEVIASTKLLLPPPGIETIVNGEPLVPRSPLAVVRTSLPTEISNDSGQLTRSRRLTTIELHPLRDGETGHIYEMGIPVVATSDPHHYNVQQKIPLGFDRDQVGASYLQLLRSVAFNTLHGTVTDMTAPWVEDAMERADCSPDAARAYVSKRFGDKAAVFDPSDLEANKSAVAAGYTIVHGGMLSKAAWDNVRAADALKPSSFYTPTPKPFSPNGNPLKLISEADWTEGMAQVAAYARLLGERLLGRTITVEITNDRAWWPAATYGPCGTLTFNMRKLGRAWFDSPDAINVDDLLLHEFGHEFASDHLSEDYYEALTRLGAKLKFLALNESELFQPYVHWQGDADRKPRTEPGHGAFTKVAAVSP